MNAGGAAAPPRWRPLADRMRPRRLDEVAGQRHLLAPGMPLVALLESGLLHSAVLWGPPGTGKTSLAQLAARVGQARFIALSAVSAGVRDIRAAVAEAEAHPDVPTVLFLDEVHRFNKAQQDAFLPAVESGTLVFIGATTENPSFTLNNALLSRARVYILKSLNEPDIVALLQRALADVERGLGGQALQVTGAGLTQLARAADGDARRALNLLEASASLASAGGVIDEECIARACSGGVRRFDRGGDIRNAPTGLMKSAGYGAGYRYAHDEPDAFAAGESCFPDGMSPREYYRPAPRGLEIRIGERLAELRKRRQVLLECGARSAADEDTRC
jgi:putative ATPase